ncbi:hypothetical protein C8T65DRAFT_96171 [Cerioporus squamosus]|nr:hypothetical protein C8T65DRAFT_96171 [Cerioporus squamosus]
MYARLRATFNFLLWFPGNAVCPAALALAMTTSVRTLALCPRADNILRSRRSPICYLLIQRNNDPVQAPYPQFVHLTRHMTTRPKSLSSTSCQPARPSADDARCTRSRCTTAPAPRQPNLQTPHPVHGAASVCPPPNPPAASRLRLLPLECSARLYAQQRPLLCACKGCPHSSASSSSPRHRTTDEQNAHRYSRLHPATSYRPPNLPCALRIPLLSGRRRTLSQECVLSSGLGFSRQTSAP